MTMNDTDRIGEEARLWAIRARDPSFSDWEALTVWLEADPGHAAALDEARDLQDWADALFATPPAPAWQAATAAGTARDAAPVVPRARRWRAGTMAASVVALAAIGGWLTLGQSGTRTHMTDPGERRTIALADGSRVTLNGDSRVTFDPDRPREVALVTGEALFEVRHDDRVPFVVTAAGSRLVDLGTVFNVVERGGTLDVAVAEGAVMVRGTRDEVRLDAGEALSRATADAAPVLRRADPEAIGTWRAGHLEFSDAPLSRVADDLSRNLGAVITADRRVAQRRFSGTVMTDGSIDAVLARTAPLLGIRFQRAGEGWTMMPHDGAAR